MVNGIMCLRISPNAFDTKVSGGLWFSQGQDGGSYKTHDETDGQGLLKDRTRTATAMMRRRRCTRIFFPTWVIERVEKTRWDMRKILRYALEKLNDDDEDEGRSKRRDKHANYYGTLDFGMRSTVNL